MTRFRINKTSRGASTSTGLIVVGILILIIITLIALILAIIGAYTSDVGPDKTLVAGPTGGMCTKELDGHTLAEVQMADGKARASQFGVNDSNLPSYCRDTGNKDYAWSSKRPTGCDVTKSEDFFAAVCTKGPSPNCGSTSSWWANKALIVTNPANGKSVTVIIIDKGPQPSLNRQLDLSYAAVVSLGFPAQSSDINVTVCLSGGGGIVGASCGSIIPAAQAYLNSGIKYGHCGCGSSIVGPSGVTSKCIDCSGFVTRVYRDAGLMPKDSCFYTVSLAQSSLLKRIATTIPQARSIMQPGDIVLFSLGDPSGNPDHGDNSHAVIYGGKSGTLDIVYESGGRGPKGTGPHVSTYNIFSGRQLYGVYRSTQSCKAGS